MGPTFFLIEGGQDVVVTAHLKVNLLLHALGDGALGDDDADARLDGAQDSSVTVEDAPGGGYHRVAFILVILVQSAGTGGESRGVTFLAHSSRGTCEQAAGGSCTLRGWPSGAR